MAESATDLTATAEPTPTTGLPAAPALPAVPAVRPRADRSPGPGRTALRRAAGRPGLLLAVLVLLTALAWACAPDLFTSHDPLAAVPRRTFRPPGPDAWFGTDYLGRDIYSRVVHGASLSLRAPVIAVGLALVGGTALGLVSGMLGGWCDALLMRLVDVVLAVPGILLSLAVVTALGFGTVNVAVAVGVAGIAGFARVTRAEVLRIRQEPYVEAARAAGLGRTAVITSHVLPHVAGPVLALAALELGTAVLAVSALSFLGLGAQPPAPEWGAMVSEGRNYLGSHWWLTALPGLTIAAVTLSVNRLARALTHRRAP